MMLKLDYYYGNEAEQKANKLLRELDSAGGIGLIERRRRGLGKPNVIYVKNFTGENGGKEKSQFKKCENHKSGNVKTTKQELRKSQTNDTDLNETEVSETDPSIPHPVADAGIYTGGEYIKECDRYL